MATVLIVDDQPSVRFTLAEILEEAGHATLQAPSGTEAVDLMDDVDLVLTDYAMPGMGGMDLLERVRQEHPAVPVIMLTARGSERVAVAALKAGASDYLPKPVDVDELVLSVERALEIARLKRDNRVMAAASSGGTVGFIGESPSVVNLLRVVQRVASRHVPILVRGETGTGKELIAKLIHAHSRRSDGPLVYFNCGAIPPELAASELFGHERGAFTGADTQRKGYFAQAHGGTLVLDEVGELPLSLQPMLLRALQEGEIQPVGASGVQHVDVRIVSCTHKDLTAAVAAGTFRQDLYYRLAVIELLVPPLRDRPSDIPLLARHFVDTYRREFGMETLRLTDEAIAGLQARTWQGNVRELENTIVRMVALTDSDQVSLTCLDQLDGAPPVATGPLRARLASYEAGILRETMTATGGNQSEAARRLGITRVTLIDKLKRHGLK